MKNFIILFMLSICAQQLNALPLIGFDKFYGGNVRVEVLNASKNVYTVKISSARRIDLPVSIYYISANGKAHDEKRLPTNQGEVTFKRGDAGSWAFRVIQDGRIIGVAGSDEARKAMAATP